MPPALPSAFLAVLNRQDGIFTTTQATSCGVPRWILESQVDAERWQHITRGVHAAFTGELRGKHRLWAALLRAGHGACLSHDTAAHRHHLVREQPPAVHVMVPAERRIAVAPGTILHRTRHAPRIRGNPPTASLVDTICDLTAARCPPDRLAAIVSTAVQRGLLDPGGLAEMIRDRGPFRGRGDLIALVADATGGAHSALELRYLRDVERRHRLPRGERQARVVRGGRTQFRDVWYPAMRVVVELDGAEHHASFTARLRDGRRDRLAAADGELTLRYGWRDIAGAPCAAAAEVAEVLIARGWTGTFRRCPRCGVFGGT